MKERKSKPEWTKETEGLKRTNQEYEQQIREPLTVISLRSTITPTAQWTCKETEKDRIRMNITKYVRSKGRKGVLKMIEYLK
jgi:hypothetical protein